MRGRERREGEWEVAGIKTEKTAACEKSRPAPTEELAGIMSPQSTCRHRRGFTLSHMLPSNGVSVLGIDAYMLSRLGTSAIDTVITG